MITCPKCGHVWSTKSAAEMVCCPSCHRKFQRPAPEIEILGRKVPLSATCDVCGRTLRDLNVCRVDGEAAFICDNCLAPGGFP